jgi:NAD(P)-dependent dehydrogenase (short-subunit alcohol dehydrogenase family)
VTTAALDHLVASHGTGVYLSSVSASLTPPWPGLGAYAVSKAALDKLVEAWRAEHAGVNFTRCIVGDCGGGPGDSATGFADNWDWDLAAELHPLWTSRGLLAGSLIDADHLVETIDAVLRGGASVTIPSITVAARPPAPS